MRLLGSQGPAVLVQALFFFFVGCLGLFLVLPSGAPEAGGEGWR